jgi:hypothetical protein
MRSRLRVLIALVLVAVLGWAIYVLPAAEVITAEGRRGTPLYDPGTVAGQLGSKPRVLGMLRPGEKLPVIGCDNRKSDIDIQVSYSGTVAVLGGGQGDFVLERKAASLWEENATTTCRGLFNVFDKAT